MKSIKIATLILSIAAASASIAAGIDGMNNMDDMKGMAKPNAQASTTAASEFSEGEIRTLYKDEGQVTIKHGEIKNLHMSAMTMMFAVKEKSMLAKLQVGDKVKFKAIEKSGALLITEIKKM